VADLFRGDFGGCPLTQNEQIWHGNIYGEGRVLTRPSPYMLPSQIWSFCVKGQPQIWGALELRCIGTGGMADPKDTRSSRHVLLRQIR